MATVSQRLLFASRPRRSVSQARRRRALALEGLEPRVVMTQLAYGLFDTGVDNSGNALAGGATDPHYTLPVTQEGTAGMNAVVASVLPPSWLADGPTAAWIAPSANQRFSSSPPGAYQYQTTFTLPTAGGGTGLLSGSVSEDNILLDIRINGTSTGFTRAEDIATATSFSVKGNFVTGANTITFVLANTTVTTNPAGTNPTGLYTQGLAVNLAPAVSTTAPTASIPYGGTATTTGTFTDPDPGDTVTLTSSQGTVTQTGTNSGTYAFTQSNVTTGGPVTITATDNHGNVTTSTITLNVVAPSVTSGGAPLTVRSGGPAVVVDPNVTITDPGGPNLSTASVSIGTNFTAAEDRLLFTSQNGITGSYNAVTGILTLTGSATPAQYQAAFRSVTYQDTNANPVTANRLPRTITFSITPGAYNPANGHFYQFIASPGISWTDAKVAADATTLFGLKGYLATLTSAAEDTFAFSKTQSTGWIGGSDAANPGTWAWADGPETGLQFWSGLVGGSPVNGQFSFWANNQPDNSRGNQRYLRFLTDGTWDDLDNTANLPGYLVEFGGSTGDPPLHLTAAVTANVTSTSDVPVVTSPASPALVNTATATLTGTADAGSLVKIYNDANNNGVIDTGESVVASQQLAAGQTTFSIATALTANAANHFLATATVSGTTESGPAVVPTITSNTIPPAPPTITNPSAAITVKTGPYQVTGTAAAGSLVKLYNDANNNGVIDTGEVVVGTQQLAAGQTTFSIATALAANAANHFLATASDVVGNVSGVAVVPTITTDSIAPVAPTLISPAAPLTINATTIPITGTAEAGSLVQIYGDTNGNGVIDTGEVVVGTQQLAAGQTSFSIVTPLAANTANHFLVTATDSAGNISSPLVVPTVTTDSIAPAALIITSPASPVLVRLATYPITGTAEAGSLVRIYGDTNGNGTIDTGEVVVGTQQLAAGQTTFSIVVPLAPNSVNRFLATATDAAGNQSVPAVVPTITTDTIAPAPPVVTSPAAPVTVAVGPVTITGTAEAGSLVQIYADTNGNGRIDAGEVIAGQVQLAAGQTTFSISVPVGSAGDGAYRFLATASDAAGNVSGVAVVPTITLLTVRPPGNLNPVVVGTVYLDLNASGTLQTGEPGLAGRVVYLDLNRSGVFATGDPTATTDAEGRFTFAPYPNATSFPVLEDTTQDTSNRYVVDQSVTNPDGSVTIGVVPYSPISPVPVVPTPVTQTLGLSANALYVHSLYKAILGRDGSASEVNGWVTSMAGGMTAQQVAALFTNSLEHRTNQVTAFYREFLHRETDPFSAGWVAQLLSGVSEETVAERILSSPEYLSAHTDPSLLVRDLYLDVLGRQGEASGIAGWQSALAAGATPRAVVARFVESTEANDQIVASLYTADLQRPRELGTSGPWTTLLNQGTPAGTVATRIISSPEFQGKSSPILLQ